MHHEQVIIDQDPCFEIDVLTREIRSASSSLIMTQFDHNSERFGFSMPRFVEGHDMSECNNVEIHFINEETQKKEQIKDKYRVSDLAIDPENPERIKFSWLLSGNTSSLEGNLVFAIRFTCFNEENIMTYSWGTLIFSGVLIAKGMNNDEEHVDLIPDVFESMKRELQNYIDGQIEEPGSSVKVFEVNARYDKNDSDNNPYSNYILDESVNVSKLYNDIKEAYNAGKFIDLRLIVLNKDGYTEIFPLRISNIDRTTFTMFFDGLHAGRGICMFLDQHFVEISDIDITGSGSGGNIEVDNEPIENSNNLITSGGVYAAIGNIEASLENIIAKYGLGGEA